MRKLALFLLILALPLSAGCIKQPLGSPTPAPSTEPPISPTPESTSLKVLGQIGGPTKAVALAGNYACVGVGLHLVILDISNSAAPLEVGATEPFGYDVEDISVTGNTAYVAAGGAGLYIVDISKPTKPVIIGHYDTPGYAEGVSVAGKNAYVADGPDGLRVIDISNSSHPNEVTSIYDDIYAFDVAIDANFAYIAGAGSGLLVADISDPVKPREISSIDTPGYAYAVSISGKIAFVADGWGGLNSVDISNPSQPKELSGIKTHGWAFDVVIYKTKAFIADGAEGLTVIDVSSPAVPKELGNFQLDENVAKPSLVTAIYVQDGEVFVIDYAQGLRIIDFSNQDNPVQVSAYCPMGFADDVSVLGNYAYVAAGQYGLRVIDISDASHPIEVGTFDTQSYALSIKAVGSLAYVGTETGLRIIDISNPSHPQLLSTYFPKNYGKKGGDHFQDIDIQDGIAYIAVETGMFIMDVTDPRQPVYLSFLDFYGQPGQGGVFGLYSKDNLTFLADEKGGLQIVDVSNKEAPLIISSYNVPYLWVVNVLVHDDSAYVTDNGRLLEIDLRDKTNPVLKNSWNLSANGKDIIWADNSVYVASGVAGITKVNVQSKQLKPSITRLPGDALGLDSHNQLICVADGDGGLFILKDSTLSGDINTALNPSLKTDSTFGQSIKLKASTPTDAADASENSLSVTGANLVVTSQADSGKGSLRSLLVQAHRGDTITFDTSVFPPANPATISPIEGLPSITQGNITIDASNAGVILDGSKCNYSGLEINSDYNIVRGLQIINFPINGISVNGGHNVIGGDRSHGDGPVGEGNLISGNAQGSFANIHVIGQAAVYNRIIGNLIGTDITGTRVIGNLSLTGAGIFIGSPARYNTVGGPISADRNIITGNGNSMVTLEGTTSKNIIIGNYIGTDLSGKTAIGNAFSCVTIEDGAHDNQVRQNVINGGGSFAFYIGDWGTWCNEVEGNLIGTGADGVSGLSQSLSSGFGVSASFVKIGGTQAGERNIISGMGGKGIRVTRDQTNDIYILGNYIGTDITGAKSIENPTGGIWFSDGTHHSFVGGATAGERNLISGNNDKGVGILIDGMGNDFNFITGNYIGTDVSGNTPLIGQGAGIGINAGDNNFIQYNLIAYNGKGGISINSGNANCIHHNNLRNNGKSSDSGNQNQWDDGRQGNCWDDYNGKDANGDGIGDKPYLIMPSGIDKYPVMNPS
jgi:hypothetical protein